MILLRLIFLTTFIDICKFSIMSTPYCYMLEKLETRQILDPAQIPLHTAPQISVSIYSPGSTYLFSPSDSGSGGLPEISARNSTQLTG